MLHMKFAPLVPSALAAVFLRTSMRAAAWRLASQLEAPRGVPVVFSFFFKVLLAAMSLCCLGRDFPGGLGAVANAQQPASRTPGEDWPDFLGSRRDGRSDETGLNWDWTGGRLKQLWTQPLMGGYGIGSTAAGRFYQLDGDGQKTVLLCLDAETGDEIWRYEYAMAYEDMYGFDNGPRTSPVLDGERVYVFGVAGKLHCLNALTGEVVWAVDTTEQFHVRQNFFGVGSTPLVHGELLLVMVGGSPPPEGGGDRGATRTDAMPRGSGIVGFDKRTGAIRYQSIDDLASYASPIVADVAGKPTGLAFCREALHAFDPDDGQVFWSFPWRARKYESVNASTPVVVDGKILITESYGPGGVLLHVVGGKPVPVWRDANIREQRLSCHWSTPVVVDGFIYGCHGEKPSQCELRCIEGASGEIRWSQPRLGRCNISYADGHLICLTDGGDLFAVRANPERFELVARWEASGQGTGLRPPCFAAPIVSQGRLYLRDANRLYCFELR